MKTQEIQFDNSIEFHADRIMKYWHRSVQGIVNTARAITDAKDKLDDEDFRTLAIEHLPFNKSSISKLIAIGRDARISAIADSNPSLLPPHWSSLYELQRFNDQAFNDAVHSNSFDETTTRSQIVKLRNQLMGGEETEGANNLSGTQRIKNVTPVQDRKQRRTQSGNEVTIDLSDLPSGTRTEGDTIIAPVRAQIENRNLAGDDYAKALFHSDVFFMRVGKNTVPSKPVMDLEQDLDGSWLAVITEDGERYKLDDHCAVFNECNIMDSHFVMNLLISWKADNEKSGPLVLVAGASVDKQ